MSPVAMDTTDASSSITAGTATRRSSASAAALIIGRRSPLKSPLRKSIDSVDSFLPISPTASVGSTFGSPRSSSDSSTDSQYPSASKRIRRPSCLLYSPVSSASASGGKSVVMSLQYEVRSLVLPEWINASGNDQNSRDSGFESNGSSSSGSSHRSTPVERSESCDSIVLAGNSVAASSPDVNAATTAGQSSSASASSTTCMWDQCSTPVFDDSELLEHILSAHVQPLEKSKTGKYACRWKDCKVYDKPSRLYAWLERHAVEKHGGTRPYGCPVASCRQRFGGRLAAERHINSHFEKTVAGATNIVIGGCSVVDVVPTKLPKSEKNSVAESVACDSKKSNLPTSDASKYSKEKGFKRSGVAQFNNNSNGDVNHGSSQKSAVNDSMLISSPTYVNGIKDAKCGDRSLTTFDNAPGVKKRNFASKSSSAATSVEDPFESRQIRDALVWRLSLALTNERLAASLNSSLPCRKRNSGINDQRTKRRCAGVGASTDTFQCKVFARRFVDDEDDDSDCEYLVSWSPHNRLPTIWMPKKQYKKRSLNVAGNLATKYRSTLSPTSATSTNK